jgi:microcystin-dependent protein
MNISSMTFDFPTGAVVPSANSSTPDGWIPCNGSSYNGTQEIYKPLWLLIGLTFGGSGQSSFKVPNLGARIPVGVKSTTSGSGLDGPVGAWDGATSVTLSGSQTGFPSHGHSSTWDGSTGDPGHDHPANYSAHTHYVGYNNQTTQTKSANTTIAYNHSGNPATYTSVAASTNTAVTAMTITGVSISNATAANASSAHTNTQPQLALNYLIKL